MKIHIGTTVTDRRGRMFGVVMERSRHYDNKVIVRSWSTVLKVYLEFPILESLLIPIHNKKIIRQVNDEDPEIKIMYEYKALDLALSTEDEDWFMELTGETKKE